MKNYIQPSVTVAPLALNTMILAGSPPAANSMPVNTGIPTDDQW